MTIATGTKHCAGCGRDASADARFCEGCGAALIPGAEPLRPPTSLEEKILSQRTGIEGERKQVTVMYTDIVGSMGLTRSLEGERWGYVLDRFLALAARAVHEFEGTVNQFTGDGLLAVFGAPLSHEDHARRACLAVLELQSRAAELAAELSREDGVDFAVRCGLNSGEVVVGKIGDDVHMDFVPIGNTTALGKRIESLAPPGSTAISASTAALVEGEFELRDLGEFEVKGSEEPQRVLELAGPGEARTRLEAAAVAGGLSRFVGRSAETSELEAVLEDSLAGNGRVVGIVGDPGVGKSRLVREFVAACTARGVRVASTRAVAHGRYVPFLPILALLRDYFGIDERENPEVARERIEAAMLSLSPFFARDLPLMFDFLGVPDPDRLVPSEDADSRQQRLKEVMASTVRARSQREPALLVFEDLHWMDEASAELFEELAEAVAGTRTLLVATYRPNYQAEWMRGGPDAQLKLEPLDSRATRELVMGLLGNDPSTEGLAPMIEERAGGNPFFLEEIVQALAENGRLAGSHGEYQLATELDRLLLPATVQAGLAARIDRLPIREKKLIQMMAVIGADIPAAVLGEVSELPPPQLAEAMTSLANAQLVLPQDSIAGPAYVFKHPLTQDVAYGSQLSEQRARIHDRVASAIERAYPGGLDERAALLAHHYESSGDLLQAAAWHARAAGWAHATAPGDAMRHWRRVADLAPDDDELAAEARTGLLRLAWRIGAPTELTETVIEEAEADVQEVRFDPHYAGLLMHSGHELEGLDAFREITRDALAGGDRGRILTVSTGVAYASWIAGSLIEGEETLNRTLEMAGDDPELGAGIAFTCPLAHAYAQRAVCSGRLGKLAEARSDFALSIDLARKYGDPETESAGYANLAHLDADAGDGEAALESAALGLELAERMENTIHVIACEVPAAMAHAQTGAFDEALATAEANLQAVREQKIGLYFEPVLLATIARSRLGLGDPETALAFAQEGVAIMNARRLAACALQAPIALADVLAEIRGDAANERIGRVLAGAAQVVKSSGAHLFDDHFASIQI